MYGSTSERFIDVTVVDATHGDHVTTYCFRLEGGGDGDGDGGVVVGVGGIR